VREGLSVCFVTEDTTRSRPDVLEILFRNAVDHGATALCLADTVGHATPDGARTLIRFTRDLLKRIGAENVRIDWHGHNDRGLALQNALWAIEVGANRIHGTALGIGERVGNVSMELLLLNLMKLGWRKEQPRQALLEYCELASRALAWTIPLNHPLRSSGRS
jgi:2-isopropylmalate synthase